MLDIRFVRENQEAVATAMKNRNASWDSSRFSELDEARRTAITEEESLQAERNAASKAIGQMMAQGNNDEAEAAKEQVRAINEKIAALSEKRDEAESALSAMLLATPNMPADSTPVGADENDNPEVRRWGTPPEFDFEFKAHWDLGPELGIIDFERAVKLAKSRFILLGGLGARLERALINFMADTHTSRGYKEWWCPAMANAETLTGTGQLPKFEEDLFKTSEGLYLIPTAEVQLTNIHSGEVPSSFRSSTAPSPPASARKRAARDATRAASSACTSSTRSRWSSTPSPKKATTILRRWSKMRRTSCSFWGCPTA